MDEIATMTGLASVLFILRSLKKENSIFKVSQKFTQVLGKSVVQRNQPMYINVLITLYGFGKHGIITARKN